MTTPATNQDEAVPETKPLLRGWLHTVQAPIALIAGIVLIILTPSPYRWTTAVFTVAGVILFGVSAGYHRGNWTPNIKQILRRLDHANIFLLIAGTYTPLCWLLLPRETAYLVLAIVWGGALAGLVAHMFWINAPRWVYTPMYIALGWVAVWFLPDFWEKGHAIVWLLLAGGLAYTIGAVFYAMKKPNPWPKVWGFHEFFHTGTILGWASHFAVVVLAMQQVR